MSEGTTYIGVNFTKVNGNAHFCSLRFELAWRKMKNGEWKPIG